MDALQMPWLPVNLESANASLDVHSETIKVARQRRLIWYSIRSSTSRDMEECQARMQGEGCTHLNWWPTLVGKRAPHCDEDAEDCRLIVLPDRIQPTRLLHTVESSSLLLETTVHPVSGYSRIQHPRPRNKGLSLLNTWKSLG
jgi:hypothetical protein